MVETDTAAPEAAQPSPAGADHTHDIYTVANVITVLRLILVPIFFSVLMNGGSDVAAAALFALAASTDWLDGQIARRTGTTTEIGKAIDPLVDRLLIASGLLGLYLVGRMPLWIVVVLLLRDVALLYGLWRLGKFGRSLSVKYVGKVTTAVLLTGFTLMILNWPFVPGLGIIESPALPGWGSEPALLGIWFVYAGLVLSLITAVMYAATFATVRREVRNPAA